MMRLAVVAALLAACDPTEHYVAKTPNWVSDTSTITPGGPPGTAIADHYRAVAAQIVAAARADRGAYQKLAELTEKVGHRLSGSPELDRAIAWAAQTMRDDGLANVHTEKVMVPHWVRGAEAAELVTPTARPLRVLGLGGTIATPKAGITAPVVVVHDWDELEAKRDQVKGAIVLYDVPMPPWNEHDGPGYGKVVGYRSQGAVAAAKHGAVATLMRSVTARSLRTVHTGAMSYAEGTQMIPSAAVTVEDAELIDRLAAKGPVTVHLQLDDHTLPDAESANVVGELTGSEHPDEVVVIGGHIDSWDVGQGAHDDGAGIVTMMEAVRVLKQLKLQPRRTIRVVCFTNEENGVRGGKGYAEAHKAELDKTVLAVESDTGGFSPHGFSAGHKDPETAKRVRERVAEIATLLASMGATRVDQGGGGTDIGPMESAGVPQIGLEVDTRTYFDYHHTDADTLDKVDPQQLADDVAAVAVLAYVVADLPDRIDH